MLADEGFRPGCALFQTSGDTTTGMIRGECEFGQRKYSSDFVVRLASGGAEYAALQQQQNVNVTVTCTGGLIQTTYYHKLIFKIPLTRYETVQLGESNSVVTLQIKPKPLWDVAAGKIVEVELFNNVASYAT